MNLSDLLDRPIAFQRSFVRLTKSINAALFLSQAMYWSKRTEDADGWFYKKQAEWEDETGLTRREQETARKNLRETGILEERLIGLPATLWFKISLENLRTTLAATASTDVRKQPSKIGGKRHTIDTETTTENTTKSTVVDLPFESEAFKAAVGMWREHLKQKKVRTTPLAFKMQMAACESVGEARAIAMINHSIMGNYQGLFEPKLSPIQKQTGPAPITNDAQWQGYLDSLCREWHPGKPDLKYAENALRRARGHVGCPEIRDYLRYAYGHVLSEWEAILGEME